MRRFLKYWVFPVSIFLLLLFFTLSLLPTLVNLQKYSSVVENHLSNVTGRSVQFGTDMTMSFFPRFGLSVSDVLVANPDGFYSEYFAKFKTLEVRLKLFPLLIGKLSFSRFVIDGLELNLEKSEDGYINWNFSKSEERNSSASAPEGEISWRLPALMSLFAVTDGTIHYSNSSTESHHDIRDLMLLVSNPKNKGMSAIEGKGALDGNYVEFEGEFASVSNGASHDLENIVADITVFDNVKVNITGNLKDLFSTPRYDLIITLPEFSPEPLLSSARSPFFFANRGLTDIQDLVISGAVKGDLKKIFVEAGIASFDKSKMKFSFMYSKEETPKLQFTAGIDFIQLDKYFPEKNFQTIGQEDTLAINKSLEFNRRQDPPTQVSGSFDFQELKVGALSLKNGHGLVTSDDGVKFQCDPVTFNLYGGSVNSVFIIDNSEETSKSIVVVQAETVAAAPFAQDFLGHPIVSGELSGTFRFDLLGADVDSLLGKLTGQGNLRLQEGKIRGKGFENLFYVDTVEMVGEDLNKINKAVKYSEVTSEITINMGLLETRSTSLKTESQNISLAGTMNLKSKDFSLKLKGRLPQLEKIKMEPDEVNRHVMISGSLLEPKLIQISHQNSTGSSLDSRAVIDVRTLVEESIPSPQGDDVKNLEGKALIDPEIVAERFSLHPEFIPQLKQLKQKKFLHRGSGKITINPLIEETSSY